MDLDAARLSLEGLSIGDAFGEQMLHIGPEARAIALTHRTEPHGRSWKWTDDTAMAVSIVEELAARGADINPDSLAHRFARRYMAEPWRGYGGGAHQVLQALAEGDGWDLAARRLFDGQGSKGNGAAMRVAPVGACFAGRVDDARANAVLSAIPTHAHHEAVEGAVALATVASAVFLGEREPLALLAHAKGAIVGDVLRDKLGRAMTMIRADHVTVAAELGNGSRVLASDTVPFALWCAVTHLDDFAEACWTCVEVGGDIDTTCAMVGGIVVGAVGLDGIPAAWRAAREPLPVV